VPLISFFQAMANLFSQGRFTLGAFADVQWTRVQSAAIALDPCENAHCSLNALHRCRVAEWITPPATEHRDWHLSSRSFGTYKLYYYKRQTVTEATVPQIVHIGDILIIKVDGCGLAVDMSAEDLAWVKENLNAML
jgi:hypothetical protein